MLAGELYLASDPELAAENQRASRLLRQYHQIPETEPLERQRLLRELLGRVGENPIIGDRFYMNYGGVILDCNRVQIGDDVLCGPSVQIYTAYHPTDPALRRTQQELAAPITIGNTVWIGGGAIICPGVTIGDNTTIGAGSVVTRDIPANVVAVGNPCRVIRSV